MGLSRNSLMVMFKILHNSIYTETSGRQIPLSHFETDLSLLSNFSASCFSVRPVSLRLPAIYFPILIRSIICISLLFLIRFAIIISSLGAKSTPLKGRIRDFLLKE